MAQTSPNHRNAFDPVDKPQTASKQTSLDDLPTEIIQEIAEYLGLEEEWIELGCRCKTRYPWSLSNLSTTQAGTWSYPSWAFSCISKRYKDIIVHGNTVRRYSLGYSRCCIKKVLAMPKNTRASVT
jgi:hypothetical protein